MTIRRYSEMIRLETFEERFEYLSLKGTVGTATFGFERYLNQRFYTSREWKQVRNTVIARDSGYDLGDPENPIRDRVLVHHMNPMVPVDISENAEEILNPEFLISVSHNTHNAIHYGDFSLIPKPYEPRRRGDTQLW